MARQAMSDWEDILNAYLEGRGLRADAEDLLMRLHLAAQDREQIERSLRLADEVTGALQSIPTPEGLGERLSTAMKACPAPERTPSSDWDLEGDDGGGTALLEDDLLDAAIEGRVSLDELYAAQASGQLSESGREALEHLEAVAGGVAEVSLPMSGAAPEGLEARLRDRLRAHMASEQGEIDERLANRLLGKRAPERGPQIVMPDVLAAGDESEKPTD